MDEAECFEESWSNFIKKFILLETDRNELSNKVQQRLSKNVQKHFALAAARSLCDFTLKRRKASKIKLI